MSLEATSVEEMGRELGSAIADLPEYERFEEAKQAVKEDDDLQEQIQAFEQQRQEFMVSQQMGDVDGTDLEEIQRAQQDLHANEKMSAFLDAQEALTARLEEINVAISEPLSIDFGGEAGGCCQD